MSCTFVENRVGQIHVEKSTTPPLRCRYNFLIDMKKPVKSCTINHRYYIGTGGDYDIKLNRLPEGRWQFQIWFKDQLVMEITENTIFEDGHFLTYKDFLIEYIDLWYVTFDEPQLVERLDRISTLAEECRLKSTHREDEIVRLWYINHKFKKEAKEFIDNGDIPLPPIVNTAIQRDLQPCIENDAAALIKWHSETGKLNAYKYQFTVPAGIEPMAAIVNKTAYLTNQGYRFELTPQRLVVYRRNGDEFHPWFEILNGSTQLVRLRVPGPDGIKRCVTITEIIFLDMNTAMQMIRMSETEPLYKFNMMVFGPWCVPVDHLHEIDTPLRFGPRRFQ